MGLLQGQRLMGSSSLSAEHWGTASSRPQLGHTPQANIHLEARKCPLSTSQHGLGTVWNKGSAAPALASCFFYLHFQHFHPPFLL